MIADYDRRIAETKEADAQAELRLEKYHFQSYLTIEKAKEGRVQYIDNTLPLDDVDPDREWCLPGHAHTHHCMEQVIATRKKADAHPDEKQKAKLRKVADDLEKRAHKRLLRRQHHYVDWRGQRKLCYVLWHRAGAYTDVWHTYPKIYGDFPGWTEEEAKAFHAERAAHPNWTPKKMSPHEFNQMLVKKFLDEGNRIKIAEARARAAAAGAR